MLERLDELDRQASVGYQDQTDHPMLHARHDGRPGPRRRRAGDPAVAAMIRDQSPARVNRSEEYTSELQSLMRTSYAVFCLQKKPLNPPLPHPASRSHTHL